jgi:hypothetical protein
MQHSLTKKNYTMKKVTTILTAIILLFSVTAFASEGEKVTAKVKLAFEKDFIKAKDVNWKKKGEFYFASFIMNEVLVDAAYNEDGELVGTSRNISTAQLPLVLSLILSQKYGQYTISAEATELSYNGETHYYVTVLNWKQALRLNCKPNGEVTIDKKIKIK